MQNLNMKEEASQIEGTQDSKEAGDKFQTIYLRWEEILKLAKRPEKKLLRHYLTSIEQMTRAGFFQRQGHRVSPDQYSNISKNTFPNLHAAYEETGSLSLIRGWKNQVMYKFPDSYPKSLPD